MITTRAEGAAQAVPADKTRFYAGGGPRLFALVRCANPGCRSAAHLAAPSISREIVAAAGQSLGAWVAWSWSRRQLHRAPAPLGWMILEYARQRFDLCSFRCLHALTEFLA